MERRQLAKDLQCKDFDWYLKNVLPELKVPHHDAKFYGKHKICAFIMLLFEKKASIEGLDTINYSAHLFP